jgi:hypothetical protein
MGRLTVRLPSTLHEQLVDLAQQEGVSLNQYIVFALTRQAAATYDLQPVPREVVREQRASYEALLQRLDRASQAEAMTILAERETVKPETDLSAETVRRVRERLGKAVGETDAP